MYSVCIAILAGLDTSMLFKAQKIPNSYFSSHIKMYLELQNVMNVYDIILEGDGI